MYATMKINLKNIMPNTYYCHFFPKGILRKKGTKS